VDQISGKDKASMRANFDFMDADGNGYFTEDDLIALYTGKKIRA
jgi:hypothetical protein